MNPPKSLAHSLVDEYMSCDAGEYARLYQYAGDPHYLAVGRVLLFNWELAPRRGYGLHRGWLPWVATSQLDGIFARNGLGPED